MLLIPVSACSVCKSSLVFTARFHLRSLVQKQRFEEDDEWFTWESRYSGTLFYLGHCLYDCSYIC